MIVSVFRGGHFFLWVGRGRYYLVVVGLVGLLAYVLVCFLRACYRVSRFVGLFAYLPISGSAYLAVVGYATCVASLLFYINIGIRAAL